MHAKALKNTLAFTLVNVKAKQLLTDWLMWKRRQTMGDTLSDVKA